MNRAQKWIAGLLGLKASTPYSSLQGRFIEVNGTVTWVSDNLSSYIKDGYAANDIIYSAVMMVMDKVRVAPWGLYKVTDESSLKKYNAEISKKTDINWAQARDLQKKALEPLTNYNSRAGKLNELLKWPNEYCTWQDQVAEGAGWKMLIGNEMLWGNMLDGGANSGIPQELIHAPAQFTTVIVKRGWPQRVVGFQMSGPDFRQFTTEEILHLKFWNPDYNSNGSNLIGMAPLKAANKTLTRNNANKKAGAVQLDNNGAVGIAYVDDQMVPVNGRQGQASLMKQAWGNEYTGADRYGKVAFSGYKMGYVSVGMSLKEMDSSSMENIDLRRLFNIWGIPSQLGNDPDNKTFNNQKEAEKALTSRCALPHLISKRDHLNRKFQTDWGFKGVNIYADFDMSVYTELQEDQKEKWGWVNQLPVSSAYKLELMGLDIPDDPNLDVILVDGNLIPLSDIVNNLSDSQMNAISNGLNKAGLTDYLKVAK